MKRGTVDTVETRCRGLLRVIVGKTRLHPLLHPETFAAGLLLVFGRKAPSTCENTRGVPPEENCFRHLQRVQRGLRHVAGDFSTEHGTSGLTQHGDASDVCTIRHTLENNR